MIEALNKIFEKLSLSQIDNSLDLIKSREAQELFSLFPNLKKIFMVGLKNDNAESERTIHHIFRVFKIFLLIKNGESFHETLSINSIFTLKSKLTTLFNKNNLILPIILMYHDIGRLFDRTNHPYKAYQLITTQKLLEPYKVNEIDKLLIIKVIQYHLLFASIYTGESTFYGTYTLLNDIEFMKLISHENYLNIFVDVLELFTFVDILGYSYAVIYDHYIEFFEEINYKLKEILQHWQQKSRALNIAKKYSIEWIDWRIAGGLRMFQFVKTKPYLTKEFFFNKLKESIEHEDNLLSPDLDWKMIKKKYLMNSYKIQIKYGLGILMLLSFGNFHRSVIKPDQKVSPNLVLFWELLTKQIGLRADENDGYLWNVFFVGLPHWSKWNKLPMNKLNYNTINFIIQNSSHELDKEKKEFSLYLDFKYLFE